MSGNEKIPNFHRMSKVLKLMSKRLYSILPYIIS